MMTFGDIRSAVSNSGIRAQDIIMILGRYNDPKVDPLHVLRYLYDHKKLPYSLYFNGVAKNEKFGGAMLGFAYEKSVEYIEPTYFINGSIWSFGKIKNVRDTVMSAWWPIRYFILFNDWHKDEFPVIREKVLGELTRPSPTNCVYRSDDLKIHDGYLHSDTLRHYNDLISSILANSLEEIDKYFYDIYYPDLFSNMIYGPNFELHCK